jgi:hypothetical protein
MSGCVGGCLVGIGAVKMLGILVEGVEYLEQNVERGVGPRPNDNKCKQICRIAANILRIIGIFCGAIGMITMGYTLITLGPQLIFLEALNQAIGASLPYFLGAFGTLTAQLIIRQVAR